MEVHKSEARHRLRKILWEYGIVVLGVITALAAQQAVESLHRRQQRRQLEEDLREEMRINDQQIRDDIEVCSSHFQWAAAEAQAIQTALHNNTIASFRMEGLKDKPSRHALPNDSVWQHARESGTVALLPLAEAQAYTWLYSEREIVAKAFEKRVDAVAERRVLTTKFAHEPDGLPDVSQMTPAQLDELSTALAREARGADLELRYLGIMAATQAVLENGSTSHEEILKSHYDSRNPVNQRLNPANVPEHEERH